MTTWLRTWLALAIAAMAALAAMANLPAQAQQALRVGSKNFTEQFVLGELYAQALEAAGIKVERRLNLGGTLIAHTALEEHNINGTVKKHFLMRVSINNVAL